jgi:HEAT repeat protein
VANPPVEQPFPKLGGKRPRVPALQGFINTTRNFGRDDPFLQALSKFSYRKRRVTAQGIFAHVRAVNDAVHALGGTVADGKAWTAQAFRWHKEGKAVEAKFARYEVDPTCMGAMNALIRFATRLPTDLMAGAAAPPFGSSGGSSPFSRPSGSFPPPPPPSPLPANPFSLPTSGRGQQPGTTPPSAPPKPGIFGRLSTFDPTPGYIVAAFDALATTPDSQSPLDMLQRLAQQMADARESLPDTPETPLPDDLTELYERYHAGESDDERGRVLKKIGAINDIRTLDHFYSVFKGTDAEPRLLNIFAHMGNDVGVAGMFSLLPISSDRRTDWLTGLCEILEDAHERTLELNAGSRMAIWQVAEAETAPGVAFCTAAYDLLALIATPQAASLLWERASSVEREDIRVIAYALMRFDPGNRLYDLLNLYANVLAMPHPPFSQRAEPVRIGIPFESLAAVVRTGKPKIAHAALMLFGRLDDPRVVPFLITQLSRKLHQLRETALRHLRRLKAVEAADAVARLMNRDEALRLLAANTLCEWDDPRCVPPLIEAARKDPDTELEKVIKQIGRFRHPAFDAWLIEGLDELKEADLSEQEEAVVEAIGLLINVKADGIRLLFEKLLDFNSPAIKQALARHLPKSEAEWARRMHQTLIADRNATVMYTAAVSSHDPDLAAQLIAASRDEIRRVLGVRILWNLKDSARLLAMVQEEKPGPARNLAIVALGFLHDPAAEPVLRRIVTDEDRLDTWGQNSALLAWRSLAKMGAFVRKPD